MGLKKHLKEKRKKRERRKRRVRAKIFGTKEKPRLCVFRSKKNIWVQVIDDEKGHTLVSASSKEVNSQKKLTKKEIAFEVGKLIAKKALELGIKKVVFDRKGYQYHGRIKSLAQGAREGGLQF